METGRDLNLNEIKNEYIRPGIYVVYVLTIQIADVSGKWGWVARSRMGQSSAVENK